MTTVLEQPPRKKKGKKRSGASTPRPLDLRETAAGAPPPVDASDDEKADYVVARYFVQDDHYRGLYQLWVKVLMFLVGKQWLRWNEQSSTYEPDTDVPEWRQQPVTNWTYAFFRAMRAKLTKNRPAMEVVPPSSDSEDREAGKLAEAILEFLWRHLKTPQKVMRGIGWFVCTGNVFFDVDWDENAGRMVPRTCLVEIPNEMHDENDPESMPTVDATCACDEDGEPYRKAPSDIEDDEMPQALDGGAPYDLDRDPDMVPEGEVQLGIDDPFTTRFNPDADSPEDATEWFIARLWPKQKVIKTFNLDENEEFGLNLGQDDGSDMQEEYADLLSRVTAAAPDPFAMPGGASTISGSDQSEGIGERLLVIYYFRKGDEDEGTPEGRHWIVAGRKKVWPLAGEAPAPSVRTADAGDEQGDDDEQGEQDEQGDEDAENDGPDLEADDADEPGKDEESYENGEAPLPHGFWPPRVPCISTPIPGQPQGIGALTQIVPLNEQYNHHDGKISEKHVVDMMGGVWFVGPADKNIEITSEPGQVRVSKEMGAKGRAGAPFQQALQAMSDAIYQEREVFEHKMQAIGGVSSVDLSQRPEGVTAGRAFLVLQEASDSAIMPDLLALEEALEEIGRRELVIVQRHYVSERTIRIRGDKGAYEFRSFKGADLRDGLDVRVQVGSSFPWSKSAQFDTKISVIEAIPQLVVDMQTGKVDREALGKYLDSGATGLSAFESDEDPDVVEFEREIGMFETYNPGQGSNALPQLGPWMNIPIKQKLCFDFMKRDFARFQRWSPAAQQAFMDWMQRLALGIQKIVDSVNPAVPGGTQAGDNAAGQMQPGSDGGGGAPGAAPQPDRTPLQLVPPGGSLGQRNTPAANKPQDKMQLTRGDLASAGQ